MKRSAHAEPRPCAFEGTASRLPKCGGGQFPVQRLRLDRGGCRWEGRAPVISTPGDAVALVRKHFSELPQESVLALHLDSASHVVGAVEIALGTIGSAPVDPRLVLGGALVAGGPRLILIHNHPSGSVEPSADDEQLTTRIQEAAKAVGLALLDSIILGEAGSYFSFEAAGRLRR